MTNNGSGLWTPGGAGEFDGKDILDEEPIWLDTIDEEDITWLWESRIPFGSVSVVDGDPDNGKSLLSTTLVADLTMGRPFPLEPEACCGPQPVLMIAGEDSLQHTIVPRLKAARADLSMVATMPLRQDSAGQVEPLMIPRDLDRIYRMIVKTQAIWVWIDPFLAFLSSEADYNHDQKVRKALMPLKEIAESTGAAISLIRHLNKDQSKSALHRGGGSVGISGTARSVIAVGKHPSDSGLFVMARVKGNLAPPWPSLAYRIEPSEDRPKIPVIAWEGFSTVTAATLFGLHDARKDSPVRNACMDQLRDILKGGHWAMAKDVKDELLQEYSEKTIARAAKELGVQKRRMRDESGKTVAWEWALGADDIIRVERTGKRDEE